MTQLFSKWQCSFQMKAALPFAKRLPSTPCSSKSGSTPRHSLQNNFSSIWSLFTSYSRQSLQVQRALHGAVNLIAHKWLKHKRFIRLKQAGIGSVRNQGTVAIYTCHFTRIKIPNVKIRLFYNCFIFIMGIIIPGKTIFILEQCPGLWITGKYHNLHHNTNPLYKAYKIQFQNLEHIKFSHNLNQFAQGLVLHGQTPTINKVRSGTWKHSCLGPVSMWRLSFQ